MTLMVEEAVERVPQWRGAADIETIPLGGGITNRNYKVSVDGEAFVLRLVGEDTGFLGIRRENEYAASVAAAQVGVAPEVVYFIQPEGCLVTRFIDGSPIPIAEMGRPANIKRVVDAIKRIHSIESIPGHFSVPNVVQDYIQLGQELGADLPQDFQWLFERSQEIVAVQKPGSLVPRPCHNDLLNGNFLDDGAIRILDWEYAGMGDVYFDLANFAVNHEFSDEQDRYLLECYFGEASEARFGRLKQMKMLSDFREAMWGVVQSRLSTLEFDFQDYALEHFDRMTSAVRDPRWPGWLEEVGQHG